MKIAKKTLPKIETRGHRTTSRPHPHLQDPAPCEGGKIQSPGPAGSESPFPRIPVGGKKLERFLFLASAFCKP